MANKVLGVTIALILQLSINTAADMNTNVNVTSEFNYKNYSHIDFKIPAEQQDNIFFIESENSFVEEYDVVNKLPETDNVLNTDGKKPVVEEQESTRIIDPNKPMIALTYDDGPSKYTKELLDLLAENNSAATFFVLGLQVEKHEEAIVKAIKNGNQIGNHSFDHQRLTSLSDDELHEQISRTDKLVYETTLYNPFVMRPPYGSTSEDLNGKIQKPIIKWSIDTRDWESRNAEIVTEIILNNVKDGDIILMHDIYETTLEASKIVIPELINRGYQLVTISELAEYRKITLTAGKSYYNMYK